MKLRIKEKKSIIKSDPSKLYILLIFFSQTRSQLDRQVFCSQSPLQVQQLNSSGKIHNAKVLTILHNKS